MAQDSFRSFSRHLDRGNRRVRHGRRQPILEPLEDRRLLASLTDPPDPSNWVELGPAPIM
jgi:hypothetical protein